jgi:hypothetical protein
VARIVVVAHEHDLFGTRPFMVKGLFPHWAKAGHEVLVREGVSDLPDADAAFLHVDASVVPPEYLSALARYPVVINGRGTDIRKRIISRNLVHPGDDYRGPVIVKTDHNSGGIPELLHNREAHRLGQPAGEPPRYMTGKYPIFASLAHVPPALAKDPALVIEKLRPERDARGFYVRFWVFLGRTERCFRYLSPHAVVKAADVLERVPVPVPDAIRARREELGLDYAKIDFVIHDGEPVLLDVTDAQRSHRSQQRRACTGARVSSRVPIKRVRNPEAHGRLIAPFACVSVL